MLQLPSFFSYSNGFPSRKYEIEIPHTEIHIIVGHVITRLQGI